MKVKSKKVNFVELNMFCDQCDSDSPIVASPLVLMSNPPQYQYTCKTCGHKENSTTLYPTIVKEDNHEK